MDKLEWLKQRQAGIGGSDVGAILGVNKYKTAFQVYIEKTEILSEVNEQSEAAYWGDQFEDIVAKEFEKRTGKKVRRDRKHYKHSEHPFMLANIDRRIVGENAILECKTANQYLASEWKDDEIPASYLLQVQHYICVTNADKAYIACLIGGQKFIWKEIKRDDELIEIIIKAEKDFWKLVEDKTPPALDGSSAAEKYLKERFKDVQEGTKVALDSEYKEIIKEYLNLKEQIKELEQQSNCLENSLKLKIGDNEAGYIDKFLVNWKEHSRTSIDSKKLKKEQPQIYDKYLKQSKYRKFEIKEEN